MTQIPRWAAALLRSLAPPGEADDVIGDLEEAHRCHLRRHGVAKARLLTALDVVEMSAAIIRVRAARARIEVIDMVQDYKLGVRMLLKYPGLTISGGLALAIAIGIGAGWYDLTRDFLRPSIPLPDGDRIVEIEVRNLTGGDERRLLHDFSVWQRDVRSIVELGAYRTVERNMTIGDARPEPVTIAETTPSAFRLVRVPPIVGRPLLDADRLPGAPPVVVLGYRVWQQRFGGRVDVVGHDVLLGDTTTTVVGVMPEGFAFPINHRLWVPLQLQTSGYSPLEGPAVSVYGRLAPAATLAQANAELAALAERAAADSPRTHQHLVPRVRAYGGESPGDRTWLELAVTHLPILLVLIVACTNVGTLVYARTATREAEIATRYALGAGRSRIVAQLFVEALVLASFAAALGLTAAHWVVRWGMGLYYSGQSDGPPFWVDPGLKPTTILYAAVLTMASALILGVLPALKATSSHVHTHLRPLGVGGSTLRFGGFWTTAMIAQVALTVICLPPAYGISQEALRDRSIRDQFPSEEYLAVRLELDPIGNVDELYAELERRIAQEGNVRAVTFADPMMIGAGTIAAVVTLGLFLSAAGIFSLMSVSVARRTREIGLRTALGASRGRLIASVFSRALTLVGSGIAAGNSVLILFVALSDEAELADITQALLMTSGVMLIVGMLACIEPARRALNIQPTDALKQA